MSRIPLLQAVAVFVKSGDEKLLTGSVPLPTFFRSDPSPLNRSHPSAAFYFNAQLKIQLDIKEWISIFILLVLDKYQNFLYILVIKQFENIFKTRDNPKCTE